MLEKNTLHNILLQFRACTIPKLHDEYQIELQGFCEERDETKKSTNNINNIIFWALTLSICCSFLHDKLTTMIALFCKCCCSCLFREKGLELSRIAVNPHHFLWMNDIIWYRFPFAVRKDIICWTCDHIMNFNSNETKEAWDSLV